MKDETNKFSWEYSLYKNTVNIFGLIDTRMAEIVISQLQYLDNRFKENNLPMEERVITIQIDSQGGSVADGLAIYDAMNYVDAKISTVALGMAASMGAFLLSSGSKGLRRATQNCEILIHQPLGGAQGQASDIMIVARHIERTRNRLNEILAENTGQSIETISNDTDRDNIMTAEEAQIYGLIDEVIVSKNKAKCE